MAVASSWDAPSGVPYVIAAGSAHVIVGVCLGTGTTVKESALSLMPKAALTFILDRRSGAVAFQISAGPAWALARVTRVHARLPPDTDAVWIPAGVGCAPVTNAISVSPARTVLN